MVECRSTVVTENVGDIRRDRQSDTVGFDALILGPRLFQSQPQSGAPSGVVVDEDAGGLPACGGVAENLR